MYHAMVGRANWHLAGVGGLYERGIGRRMAVSVRVSYPGCGGGTMRDIAVQLWQLLRDLGPTPGGARQAGKVLLRAISGAKPGSTVVGIRRHGSYDFSMGVPFGFVNDETPPPAFRIAAACHMFYADLSGEFRAALARIPGRLDVLLSTDTEDKCAEIAQTFMGWDKGEVDVRIVANRGRDIGPKLAAHGDLRHRYDLVLYLHSKRSIGRTPDGSVLDDGSDWRRYLLRTLAGSPAITGSILEAFRSDPRLGIVMAQHWDPVRIWINWGDNFFVARDLARRMGIGLTPAHSIDFPAGSMFWARPAALGPILDLGLRVEDFPDEPVQDDGTLAHAIERLFLFACEAAGYRWVKCALRLLYLSRYGHPHRHAGGSRYLSPTPWVPAYRPGTALTPRLDDQLDRLLAAIATTASMTSATSKRCTQARSPRSQLNNSVTGGTCLPRQPRQSNPFGTIATQSARSR